jgi:hypothetical protein
VTFKVNKPYTKVIEVIIKFDEDHNDLVSM